MLGMVEGHPAGSDAAHVTTLREERLEFEMIDHEVAPHATDLAQRDRSRRCLREAKARNARHDDRERVLLPTAESLRMCERVDHAKEFDDRTGPAMGDDQGPRILAGTAFHDEVDIEVVDTRPIVREAV